MKKLMCILFGLFFTINASAETVLYDIYTNSNQEIIYTKDTPVGNLGFIDITGANKPIIKLDKNNGIEYIISDNTFSGISNAYYIDSETSCINIGHTFDFILNNVRFSSMAFDLWYYSNNQWNTLELADFEPSCIKTATTQYVHDDYSGLYRNVVYFIDNHVIYKLYKSNHLIATEQIRINTSNISKYRIKLRIRINESSTINNYTVNINNSSKFVLNNGCFINDVAQNKIYNYNHFENIAYVVTYNNDKTLNNIDFKTLYPGINDIDNTKIYYIWDENLKPLNYKYLD